MSAISIGGSGVTTATTTLAGTYTGSFAVAQAKNIILKKTGDTVTMLSAPTEAAAASAAMSYSLDVPVGFRPSVPLKFPIIVTNNSVDQVGNIDVSTAGVIKIYKDATSAVFDGTGNNGFKGYSVTWTVA